MDLSSLAAALPRLTEPSSPIEEATSPRAPIELLESIVEVAIADLVEDLKWKQAARLCLVSPSLLPFAQAALYHTIVLYHDSPQGLTAPPKSILDSQQVTVRNPELLRTLGSVAPLAHAVRRLVLLGDKRSIWYSRPRLPTPPLQPEITFILRRCDQLCAIREVRKRWTRWSAVARALEEVGAVERMVSLKLARWAQQQEGLPALEHASQLKHLVLELDETGSGTPISFPSQAFFRLRSAEFIDSGSLGTDAKDALDHHLAHSAESLSHLAFDHTSNTPSIDLARYRSLVSLDIRGYFFLYSDVAAVERMLAIVATCRGLKLLRLASRTEQQAPGFARACEEIDLLSRLPHTVVHLDIRNLPFSLAHLLALLQPAVSPSLHRLDVRRLVDEYQQQQLEKACSDRGVELSSYPRREFEWSGSREADSGWE